MNRAKRRWFPKKPICEGGSREFLTVGLQEVRPALMLLSLSMGLSLTLMILELCIYWQSKICKRRMIPVHVASKRTFR